MSLKHMTKRRRLWGTAHARTNPKDCRCVRGRQKGLDVYPLRMRTNLLHETGVKGCTATPLPFDAGLTFITRWPNSSATTGVTTCPTPPNSSSAPSEWSSLDDRLESVRVGASPISPFSVEGLGNGGPSSFRPRSNRPFVVSLWLVCSPGRGACNWNERTPRNYSGMGLAVFWRRTTSSSWARPTSGRSPRCWLGTLPPIFASQQVTGEPNRFAFESTIWC